MANRDNFPEGSRPLSMSTLKNAIRKTGERKWQRRWSLSEKGRWTYSLLPTVKIGKFKSVMRRKPEVKYNRLKLGHTRLKDNMNKIMRTEFPTPNCDCGRDRETIEHYLLECPKYENQRLVMFNNIDAAYHITETSYEKRNLNTKILLGDNVHLAPEMRYQISKEVATFLATTDSEI